MWKDSETEIDYLNINYLVSLLEDIIKDETLAPATVGVYGDWGSGKSSLIEMSLNTLKNDKNTVTVKFNGWLFEGYDDAKTILLSTILDTIVENKKNIEEFKDILNGLYKSIDKIKLAKSAMKFGIDMMATGGIVTAAKYGLSKVKDIVTDKSTLDAADTDQIKVAFEKIQNEVNLNDYRHDIANFRANFEELLKKTKIDKLVVYIDELDRCNPDTILETLEAIRLFVFVGKTYFIIGADERHIQYSVQRKFSKIEGNQINIGKEYLEKIIQYPVNIPRLRSEDVEFYLLCLLCERDLSDEDVTSLVEFLKIEKNKNLLTFSLSSAIESNDVYRQNGIVKTNAKLARNLAPILSRELNGNPRQCKRFLNTMDMRQKMATYNSQQLSPMILSKMMLLEYFKQDVFNLLLNAQANNDQEVFEEIRQVEIDINFELKNPILKKLHETSWGKVWFIMEPKIGETNLQPYFYFSREKNKGADDLLTFGMSPAARHIFELLSAHAFNYEKNVASLIEGITLADQQEILELFFYEKIDRPESIDYKDFSALLFYGTLKAELIPNLVSVLRLIPFEDFKASFAPSISKTIEGTDNQELSDLVNQWKDKDTKFSKALKLEKGGI